MEQYLLLVWFQEVQEVVHIREQTVQQSIERPEQPHLLQIIVPLHPMIIYAKEVVGCK